MASEMMDVSDKLRKMQKEVENLHKEIMKISEIDPRVKKLYKGSIIYLSPLYKNPNVLVLGINPGSGFFRKHNKVINQFEPQKGDYHKGYDYWKDLENCFKKIGKPYLLDKMVKTNTCFIATYNYKELELLLDYLPEDVQEKIIFKKDEWIKTLIDEIQPKYIICAGFHACAILRGIYADNFEALIWNKETRVNKIGEIKVFTFKRLFSRMIKRKSFMNCLNQYIGSDTNGTN
jgi:hypothetical protein